jgi:ribosomal protein S18 acetylase RimI-like enzyme
LYVDSGLSCDTFNILHISQASALTPAELTRAIRYYRDHQLEFCIWVNRENCTPGVRQVFAENEISRQNEEVGMVLDLSDYTPLHQATHQNVQRATSPEHIRDYAQVVSRNWNPPDGNVSRFYEKAAPAFLDNDNGVKLLLYYHENRPVATLELFPTDNSVTGIYGFATLEAFRGRGIGSALFTFALNQAKAAGYEKIILQASEDGLGIYKKYGFKSVTTYYEYA